MEKEGTAVETVLGNDATIVGIFAYDLAIPWATIGLRGGDVIANPAAQLMGRSPSALAAKSFARARW